MNKNFCKYDRGLIQYGLVKVGDSFDGSNASGMSSKITGFLIFRFFLIQAIAQFLHRFNVFIPRAASSATHEADNVIIVL